MATDYRESFKTIVASSTPWYRRYADLRLEVESYRERFRARCKELHLAPETILLDFKREILARAVLESNWQEGIELEAGPTQALLDLAFDEASQIAGPHLDVNGILRFHRDAVVLLKRKGASREELAAYNLARAYHAVDWVGTELGSRIAAYFAQALRNIRPSYEKARAKNPSLDPDLVVQKGFEVLEKLQADPAATMVPLTPNLDTQGALVLELLKLNPESLSRPMDETYLHFFHRIILMGIIPSERVGRYRRSSVHVGNPDLFFPVPAAVPQMMKEFCRNFPAICPSVVEYDPILVAARTSHRFVSIHPYNDGNGRVSRVLMNLILWGHHPPVYLKADKKGRHRYSQSLKRADRGQFEPLAALIATSLIEIYEKICRSLNAKGRTAGKRH